MVEYACALPELVKGSYSEQVSTAVDMYSIRQPLGVVAGITPFNFPAMVPMWMFPMAIACGNTFVLKAASFVPQTAMKIAELFEERRSVVPVDEIPEVMVEASIAAEDADFFKHRGLDYLGMLRAFFINLRAGGFVVEPPEDTRAYRIWPCRVRRWPGRSAARWEPTRHARRPLWRRPTTPTPTNCTCAPSSACRSRIAGTR